MDTQGIITALEAERDRLDQALTALNGMRRGRPAGTNGRKRHLSAAARKRISNAMKKKWAARKRAAA
jgi:hypothetical protein